MLFFRTKEKHEVSLWSLLTLSRLPITRGHINIWHMGTVRMAVLFTNTILGFQRLLCNSWEYRLCVSVGAGAEESNSLIHSQGVLVWLRWGHEPEIKMSRSGSAPYAGFLPKPQRLCLNIGLMFHFPPAEKQNQLCQTFLCVILGNVGKLCLGSVCNLWCTCPCCPASQMLFLKNVFSYL